MHHHAIKDNTVYNVSLFWVDYKSRLVWHQRRTCIKGDYNSMSSKSQMLKLIICTKVDIDGSCLTKLPYYSNYSPFHTIPRSNVNPQVVNHFMFTHLLSMTLLFLHQNMCLWYIAIIERRKITFRNPSMFICL
mgnify:CR=1 FL=1